MKRLLGSGHERKDDYVPTKDDGPEKFRDRMRAYIAQAAKDRDGMADGQPGSGHRAVLAGVPVRKRA
jgi:hypothetical protein